MKSFNVNKRGALSLGITTIVYLVIAMVIIGAAVSFVQTGFSTGTETLTQAIPSSDLTINPTSARPVELSSNSIQVQQGGDGDVQVGVYNKDTSQKEFSVNVDCVPSRGKSDLQDGSGDYVEIFEAVSLKQDIGASATGGFEIIFVDPEETYPDSTDPVVLPDHSPFVCSLEVLADGSSYSTKDLRIEVTS